MRLSPAVEKRGGWKLLSFCPPAGWEQGALDEYR